MGAISYLTPERHTLAMKAFMEGASNEQVAQCLGVSEACIYGWFAHARDDMSKELDTIYTRFLRESKEHKYNYDMSLCKEIERQGRATQWTALAWLLERRNPDVFGKNTEENKRSKVLEERMDKLIELFSSKVGVDLGAIL